MSNEPWVSVDEVAKHLSVAKDSVYRWIERKDAKHEIAETGDRTWQS